MNPIRRDRSFIIELVKRPNKWEVKVTDYLRGAVRFHECEGQGNKLGRENALLSASRAVERRIKEIP